MQDYLKLLADCFIANAMKLSVHKNNYMLFNTRRNNSEKLQSQNIGKYALQRVHSTTL